MNDALKDINQDDFDATYSPEDNKLRFTAAYRLDEDLFKLAKEHGFKWAPKQELFVAPKWTPDREDFCLALAGEITAEGTTVLERAQAKAERLDNLALKRSQQANSFHAAADRLSERFAYGQPILVGHHSERSARKDKDRMESAMDQAVKAHNAVDYWHYRAEGVERHANRKNDAGVRARRIKTLLKELRDAQRVINHGHLVIKLWETIKNETDRERFEKLVDYYAGANIPTGSATGSWDHSSQLRDSRITRDELVEQALAYGQRCLTSEHYHRQLSHTLNRLGYERSQLGETARYEGDFTKGILQTFAREQGAHKPEAKLIDGDWELGSSVPLPAHIADNTYITMDEDGWRDLMQASGYTVPAPKVRKPSSKAHVPLLNPSPEEALKLQTYWNELMVEACEGKLHRTPKNNEVREATQAGYAARSKGDYAPYKTIEINDQGKPVESKYENYRRVKTSEPVCRIRVYTGGGDFYKPDAVVTLTDKPNKPLPINWPESKEQAA